MQKLYDTEFEGYVYLDHHHPPILWNIVRGGFNSVSMLPENERNFATSVSLASMLQNSSVDRLKSELALELKRQQVAPSGVSLITGLFVFDEVESVAQIWDANSWGGHFQQEYLADVGVYAKNSSRVDANWIADVVAQDGSLQPQWEDAAQRYWQGIPYPGKTPIWERIVDGTFCIWSMHSKQAALNEIKAIWPQSIGLLTHSMNCFAVESYDGQCFSGLIAKESHVELAYFLRMVDSQTPELIQRLQRLPHEKPNFFAGIPDLNCMRTPDLSGYSISLPISDADVYSSLSAMLSLVRRNTHTIL